MPRIKLESAQAYPMEPIRDPEPEPSEDEMLRRERKYLKAMEKLYRQTEEKCK